MTKNLDRHLGPEELIEFIDGRLDSRTSAAANQHILECGGCRAELALARSFQEQVDVDLPPEIEARIKAAINARRSGSVANDRDQPSRRRGQILPLSLTWVRVSLLAASVVFAALGLRGMANRPTAFSPGGEMRSAGVDSVWEIDLSAIDAGVVRVDWESRSGVDGYRLELRSASGEVLWSREVDGSPVEIQFDQLPAGLQEQRALFVSVSGRMVDGNIVASRPRALPAFPRSD